MDITIYTRKGCHLCEEAKALLARYGLRPTLIEIDEDPPLLERFGDSVPVVEVDGQVRFRGRVDEVLLRRLLESQRGGS